MSLWVANLLHQIWGNGREDCADNWKEEDVDGIYGAWANLAEQELADTLVVQLDPNKAKRKRGGGSCTAYSQSTKYIE